MKIKIHNIKLLLDDKLSLLQRGLLVTILLLRDDDPKVWMAKVKAKVNIKQESTTFAELHEAGYIHWPGYNNYIKNKKKVSLNPQVTSVIEYMNKLYGRKFNANSDNTTKYLRNRLDEYSVEDVKLVIANRWEEWKNDPTMSKYLKPDTIFRPSKFEKYLEDAQSTNVGKALVNAEALGLRNGDEITMRHKNKLVSNHKYLIKFYGLNEDGERLGDGIVEEVTGRRLKTLLVSAAEKKRVFGVKDYCYVYLEN